MSDAARAEVWRCQTCDPAVIRTREEMRRHMEGAHGARSPIKLGRTAVMNLCGRGYATSTYEFRFPDPIGDVLAHQFITTEWRR